MVALLNKIIDLFWEIKKQLAAMFMRQSAAKVDEAVDVTKSAKSDEEKLKALDEIMKVERDL